MEIIYGEKVYLRPITVEDTDLIVKWRNSEVVRPYFIYQKPFTREGHMHWLETMIFSGKGYQFIVHDKETDEPIGSSFLKDYDKEQRKIEFGMFLGSNEVKGKGIGAELIQLTTNFAFEELNIHKVYSRVIADNGRCLKSCQRSSVLMQEGLLKDEVLINGEYRDIIMLGAINPKEQ